MKYTKWAVRPVTETKYLVYRMELGGEFKDKEEAEHLAYELNKEARGD